MVVMMGMTGCMQIRVMQRCKTTALSRIANSQLVLLFTVIRLLTLHSLAGKRTNMNETLPFFVVTAADKGSLPYGYL